MLGRPRPVTASPRSPRRFILPAAFVLLLALSTSATGQDAADYHELPRFSKVGERLYRGAQPREGGLRRLAELGINTVINLRGASGHTRSDEAEATGLGLRYFNVPMPVWGRPEDGHVLRVLEIISAPGSGRVFVHCKDGVDRTGMVVALYRITADGWSADAAAREAEARGMRRVQIWMRDYIDDYYRLRVRDAAAGTAARHGYDKRDFGDRLGSYARAGERVTFKARKAAGRVLRGAPGSAGAFIGRVF